MRVPACQTCNLCFIESSDKCGVSIFKFRPCWCLKPRRSQKPFSARSPFFFCSFLSCSHRPPNMNASPPEKAASSNSPEPTTKYDQVTYRDLVIFEERLRGNMIRLRKRKRKFEGMSIDPFACYNHLSIPFYSSSLLSTRFIGLLFLCCLCRSKQGNKKTHPQDLVTHLYGNRRLPITWWIQWRYWW